MLNFNHLYYFYVTVKSQSVSTAAKRLSISQPSVSSQLKVLEDYLQVKLFEKSGRKNTLTKAGHEIFSYCQRMFEVSEELDRYLIDRTSPETRQVNIGVSDDIERSFLSEVISHFLQKCSTGMRPKMSISSGSTEQLVNRLQFKELDAIVTTEDVTEGNLVSLLNIETPVALIGPAMKELPIQYEKLHLASQLKNIISSEGISFVMPSTSFKFRKEIDQFFEIHSIQKRIVFESDITSSLVRSVIDEIGFAFIPLIYVDRESHQKKLSVFGPADGFWKYKLNLSCHLKKEDDPVIRSLAESFQVICSKSNTYESRV